MTDSGSRKTTRGPVCEGSYLRTFEATKRDHTGTVRLRGRCPECGKDVAVNPVTDTLRVHRVPNA